MTRAQPLLLSCIVASGVSSAAAQCLNPVWTSEFASGLSNLGNCMAVYDPDGPGPLPAELYVGGIFTSAGGIPAARIARWNGQTWSAVGGGMTGSSVTALTVFDPDGSGPGLPVLVAAGFFSAAGGVPASRIAAWNGTQWSALGSGYSSGTVECMIGFDEDGPGPQLPKLWIGGSMSFGTVNAGVAVWDGQSWAPQQDSAQAFAMAVFDEDGAGPANPSLFIGTGQGVFRWDGAAWQTFGGGLTRSGFYVCNALRVVDEDGPGPGQPVLLAGGNFSFAGGNPANSIARWNGTAWSAMGSGIGSNNSAEVKDIVAVDNAGGAPTIFASAAGFQAGAPWGVFRWSPAHQSWTVVGEVLVLTHLINYALESYAPPGSPPSLYFTGGFSSVSGVAAQNIAHLACDPCSANCDGSTTPPRLTANDFQCFLNAFAAGDPYANCDGSTSIPNLTANDFQCFLNRYAAGCP